MLKAENLVDFEEWLVAAIVYLTCYRDFAYYNFPEILYLWRHHNTFQEGIIVVEVSDLAGLTEALAISESLGTEVPGTVQQVVVESLENHETYSCQSRAPLT